MFDIQALMLALLSGSAFTKMLDILFSTRRIRSKEFHDLEKENRELSKENTRLDLLNIRWKQYRNKVLIAINNLSLDPSAFPDPPEED